MSSRRPPSTLRWWRSAFAISSFSRDRSACTEADGTRCPAPLGANFATSRSSVSLASALTACSATSRTALDRQFVVAQGCEVPRRLRMTSHPIVDLHNRRPAQASSSSALLSAEVVAVHSPSDGRSEPEECARIRHRSVRTGFVAGHAAASPAAKSSARDRASHRKVYRGCGSRLQRALRATDPCRPSPPTWRVRARGLCLR